MEVENSRFLTELLGEEISLGDKSRLANASRHARIVVEAREKKAFSEGAIVAARLFMPTLYAFIVLVLFAIGNFGVWWLIYNTSLSEMKMIEAGKPIERLITSDVLKTLIIATASQTAAAFMVVVLFMYGKGRSLKELIDKDPA